MAGFLLVALINSLGHGLGDGFVGETIGPVGEADDVAAVRLGAFGLR
jgi:hypothetical protein